MNGSDTKVMTPKAILSYPHLDEPQPGQNGGKAKYSCTLIFPAGTDLSALEAAATAAAYAKFGAKAKAMLQSGVLTLRGGKGATIRTDSAAKGYPEGSVFVNVRTERQPGMVYLWADASGRPAPIPQEKIVDDLYPGAFVRASINAFGYDNSGNKGVSFALNNIQKLGDGPRLDGRAAAQDEFEADLNAAPADLADVGAE